MNTTWLGACISWTGFDGCLTHILELTRDLMNLGCEHTKVEDVCPERSLRFLDSLYRTLAVFQALHMPQSIIVNEFHLCLDLPDTRGPSAMHSIDFFLRGHMYDCLYGPWQALAGILQHSIYTSTDRVSVRALTAATENQGCTAYLRLLWCCYKIHAITPRQPSSTRGATHMRVSPG
jgi:hypothetical protein